MKLQGIINGVLVLGLIALGVFILARSTPTQPLGSVTGPDSYFVCETHNGLQTCATGRPLTLATTTPCSIQSPTATSTIVRAGLNISVATSTATVWTLATSTTAFSTTSALTNQFSLGSGAQGAMTYTGTTTALNTTINNAQVLPPNTWVNWGVQGTAISGTTYLKGTCNVEFKVI